jgi:mannose-6-phosphate isomerase-like protein (cupin superfamily)
MELNFSKVIGKLDVFTSIKKYLLELGFVIINQDDKRPWGGFFVIDENQAEKFIKNYFPEYSIKELLAGRISPKILIVEPGKKLSWQYHHRRSELWKIIGGEALVVTSDTDEEKESRNYIPNSIIKLNKGERHRLIGLNTWGIVAEIWQHTDTEHPSDEDDIIRVQDDFGR